jgi:diguanylate cyclase (GGDEF)-like protein
MHPTPLHILLVDDQNSLRQSLSQDLSQQGHHVTEASSAAEALALFTLKRPDLVLMDVVMPGEDGYWAARQIRAVEGGDWTPIIFLSSRDSELDLLQGIEAGGDDYLFKPASPVVLRAKLHAMTRLQRMRQQLLHTSEALRQANQQLTHLSTVDPLTQLGNRRAFDERLGAAMLDGARNQRPLSLILCDVDHFKRYNDALGHVQGDQCLRDIATLLRLVCRRPLDFAARYGGEEFALILPDTPKSGAMTFARGLQAMLHNKGLYHPASKVSEQVTLSGGITTLVPGPQDKPQSMLLRADEALYSAKAQGRNRFFSFEMQLDTEAQLEQPLRVARSA